MNYNFKTLSKSDNIRVLFGISEEREKELEEKINNMYGELTDETSLYSYVIPKICEFAESNEESLFLIFHLGINTGTKISNPLEGLMQMLGEATRGVSEETESENN